MTGEKGKRLVAGVIGLLLAAPFASAEGVPWGSGPWKSTIDGCADGAMVWMIGFDGRALADDIERRLGKLKSRPQQPDERMKEADTPAVIKAAIKMHEPAALVGRWNGGGADRYRAQKLFKAAAIKMHEPAALVGRWNGGGAGGYRAQKLVVEAAPGMKVMTTPPGMKAMAAWTFGSYERTGVERVAQAAVVRIVAGPAVGEVEFSPGGPCRPNAGPAWTPASAVGKAAAGDDKDSDPPSPLPVPGIGKMWTVAGGDRDPPPFPLPMPGIGKMSYKIAW